MSNGNLNLLQGLRRKIKIKGTSSKENIFNIFKIPQLGDDWHELRTQSNMRAQFAYSTVVISIRDMDKGDLKPTYQAASQTSCYSVVYGNMHTTASRKRCDV